MDYFTIDIFRQDSNDTTWRWSQYRQEAILRHLPVDGENKNHEMKF